MKITVKQIVEEYLKKNGFDGLFNDVGDCACCLDDLCTCNNEGIENCKCGYKRAYDPDKDNDDLEESEWVISEIK